tara:strand:+ start:186 stop:956 length:771 start_codon:yes stop_codon:yes gene_type:complete
MTLIKNLKKTINNILYYTLGLKIVNQKYRDINNKLNFIKRLFDNKEKLIIFDVGQNIGEVSDFFLKIFDEKNIVEYEIHGFEPDKKLFEHLTKKYAKNNKIILNNLALSKPDNVGEKVFYNYEDNQKNSLNKIEENYLKYVEQTKVKVDTLNTYCKKKNIKKINFLKIDAEGEEPNILLGSDELINNNQINYIYTELTTGNYYDKKSLRIIDIESKLNKNYKLIGIDTMNIRSEIFHADKNNSITMGLIYANYSNN